MRNQNFDVFSGLKTAPSSIIPVGPTEWDDPTEMKLVLDNLGRIR
jgi:hypothetical protein